jgi:hypothetical protein
VFAGAISAAPAGTVVSPRLVLEDWGLFCEVSGNGSEPAPETSLGSIRIIDQVQRPVRRTTVIPGNLGLGFGAVVRLADGTALPVPYRIELLHPPMAPTGATRQAWDGVLTPGETSVNTWEFAFPEEIVPGDWTYRLTSQGEVLLDMRFVVTPPDPQAQSEFCGGAPQISQATSSPRRA